MNSQLNILSIDFDYFQNVSIDTMYDCYPDGIDLPSEITVLTWASYYANHRTKQKLSQVTIDTDKLNIIKNVLYQNCECHTPVLIANSHYHIYNFIKELVTTGNIHFTNIMNLDMHHDFENHNRKTVDCGNWVSHALNSFPNCNVQWIANEQSEAMYGTLSDTIKLQLKPTTSLDIITDTKFDAIFICRSDTWLPPHLDKHFDDLLHTVVKRFSNNMVDIQVQKPRNIAPIIKQLETIYTKANKQS